MRAQEAVVASKLDVQKASLGRIDAALQALDSNLSMQRGLLAQTNQELADARLEVHRDAEAVRRTESHMADLVAAMRERAIASYVSPPSDQVFDLLRMQSFKAANYRRMYGEVQAANDADLADELKSSKADLQFIRRQAAHARHVIETKQRQQQARTDKVATARARQLSFASALKRRIDSSVARSIRLARTDKALSTRIAREQAALAARLAAARAAAAAAAQAAADRAAAAAAARAAAADATRQNSLRPNGTEFRALPVAGSRSARTVRRKGTGTVALPPVSSGSVRTSSGGISLATVNGITVNAQIAGRLGSLVNAARGAGLNLTGSGYRDPAQQVALRQAHCGSSYYAIYQMPASSCNPETAPPGTSMHEVGLAVDFSACQSRSTACYQWLSGNASRFGFFNLPSESWHWSINGN